MLESWRDQIDALTSAFLKWKHGNGSSVPNTDEHHKFEVTEVGVREFTRNKLVRQAPNELGNVSLIQAGLLGCSPLQPTVAITLEALELFHQIRRRQSSFSTQAMAKVLCALHNVSFIRCYSTLC